MRLVLIGSGDFGLPSWRTLADHHAIAAVVTRPDRPSGRGRPSTATPVADWARREGYPLLTPEDINAPEDVAAIRATAPEAIVVIAYGRKLATPLLADLPAMNLHASLLPRYRGAAPIQRAVMAGDRETGVTVFSLVDAMDAGPILGKRATAIDPSETAGELAERLALDGAELLAEVVNDLRDDDLVPAEQDEHLATDAPRLTSDEGTVSFDLAADLVRARVHGLTPWPGCSVILDGTACLLRRVRVIEKESSAPGTILDDGSIACATGAIRVEEIQPRGRRAMTFEAFRNGHAVRPGNRCESA